AVTSFGAMAFARLRLPPWQAAPRPAGGPFRRFAHSYGTVLGLRPLRPVLLLNLFVGLTFMGAFLVGIPLLVRDLHGGTPGEIAAANMVNMAGIIVSVALLLRRGGIHRC